jgi:uncharacterized protein (DUF1684 family)
MDERHGAHRHEATQPPAHGGSDAQAPGDESSSAERAHDHRHEGLTTADAYAHAVQGARAAKDEFFRESPDSPIPDEARNDFTGLDYFPADLRYRIEGLQPGPVPEGQDRTLQMQTSDGQIRDAERAGMLDFTLDDQPLRLTAFRFAGDEPHSIFVPFQDATSGSETYGAGRYMDLEVGEDGTVDLDFNLAYNPFCAYSEAYSCPLPPAENRLPVRVEAGERA